MDHLPSSVGRASPPPPPPRGSKNDPNNMQTLKKIKHLFAEKFWGKNFALFSKIFKPKFSDFCQKQANFSRFWTKKEKKIAKTENLSWLRP